MNKELNGKKIAVIGLGVSNISVIPYLLGHNLAKLSVFDTRVNPPFVEQLPRGIDLRLGELSFEVLKDYDMLVVSPGLSINKGAILQARKHGVQVVGDIELFAKEAKGKVIGITGSNGKSTVTALVGYMAYKAGLNVEVGANFGNSVFDILDDSVDLYVLELSSFELETTSSLYLDAAVILNISEDHLDRYDGSLDLYSQAKTRIFKNCKYRICNRDDVRTFYQGQCCDLNFGLDDKNYGLIHEDDTVYLAKNGKKVFDASKLLIQGTHNYLNALAAMALCDCVGISEEAQIKGLVSFNGLAHRCQMIKKIKGISFINDSKATNVASTEAAICGLKDSYKKGIILLAGGLGKGQDFTPLKKYLGKEVSFMFCFGKDGKELHELNQDKSALVLNLRQALNEAYKIAKEGQVILLSPACASFDQFKGYEERGRVFVSLVNCLEG